MSEQQQQPQQQTAPLTDAEIAGFMNWRGPGAYTAAALRRVRRAIDEAVKREKEACAVDCEDRAKIESDKAKNSRGRGDIAMAQFYEQGEEIARCNATDIRAGLLRAARGQK